MNKRGSVGGRIRATQQREKALQDYYENPNVCEKCNKVIEVGSTEKVGQVRKKKFCSHSCAATSRNLKRGFKKYYCECGAQIKKSSSLCQACYYNSRRNDGEKLVKGEVKREHIAAHARAVMRGKLNSCYVCGYSLHVEVCHIKAVKDYEDGTTLDVINAPSNLVGLCPNHHWELDKGYLRL